MGFVDDSSEDHTHCPVRTILNYADHTNNLRQDKKHLRAIYRSGGLIDSCSAFSVFTTCHSGRLGDTWTKGAKYWAPSDDRVG